MLLRATLLSLSLSFIPITAQQPTADKLEDVLEQQRQAWNRGDIEAFMQSYWNSPELTFFSGDKVTRGWKSTLDRYRKTYMSEGRQMGQLSFTEFHKEMLSNEAAVVTARWHLHMLDGQDLGGLTTLVCRRVEGKWKIVHDHTS